MSRTNYHSDPIPPLQEVDLSDARWNEVISTACPPRWKPKRAS